MAYVGVSLLLVWKIFQSQISIVTVFLNLTESAKAVPLAVLPLGSPVHIGALWVHYSGWEVQDFACV